MRSQVIRRGEYVILEAMEAVREQGREEGCRGRSQYGAVQST